MDTRWMSADFFFVTGSVISCAQNRKPNQKLLMSWPTIITMTKMDRVLEKGEWELVIWVKKKPLNRFNLCSEYIWAVVQFKSKQSRICPQSLQLHLHPEVIHLNICTAAATCACERFHVMNIFIGNNRAIFVRLDALREERWMKVQGSHFWSGSKTSVACMSLQEDSQHWLVNRKQAHLVRVAFYGLTDSNSISREPEEDEFL